MNPPLFSHAKALSYIYDTCVWFTPRWRKRCSQVVRFAVYRIVLRRAEHSSRTSSIPFSLLVWIHDRDTSDIFPPPPHFVQVTSRTSSIEEYHDRDRSDIFPPPPHFFRATGICEIVISTKNVVLDRHQRRVFIHAIRCRFFFFGIVMKLFLTLHMIIHGCARIKLFFTIFFSNVRYLHSRAQALIFWSGGCFKSCVFPTSPVA